MRYFNKNIITYFFTSTLLIFSVSLLIHPASVTALSGTEFQAGRITDDGVFFDPNGMALSDIQRFLTIKVPACDTSGAKMYNSTLTRAQYGASQGNLAPYTCLKDYTELTPSRAAEMNLCNAYAGGAKNSSQIIYDVAQACNVNPKVLIVLLQKEQSLITDDWPWPIQYRSATGFGCPDTADCDARYYGFFNQVYNAARIYKVYANSPTLFNYRTGRNNNILFNPNNSCGSSSIYIQNQATAGLYIYTPYQPNQAALDNLYGSGDGCSAYGNRNFWRMYSDWFGTTYAQGYATRLVSQSGYPTIGLGESKTVFLNYKNMGIARWYDNISVPTNGNPIHLASAGPLNRSSAFSKTWVSPARPTINFSKVYESDGVTLAANQHAVEPGQIAVFEFQFSAPKDIKTGVYREFFQPILEGASNYDFGGVSWLDIGVENPYKAQYRSQSPYPSIVTNTKVSSYIEYKNIGTAYWYDDLTAANNNTQAVHLASTAPVNRASNFSSSWPSPNRAASLFSIVYASDGVTLSPFQHVVRPGEVVRFSFDLTARDDAQPGVSREYFQPIIEGTINYDMGGVAWVDASIIKRSGGAQYVSQSNFPLSSPGQSNPVFLSYRNSSNAVWYDSTVVPQGLSPLNLATTSQINRSSGFAFGWPSNNRPAIIFSKVYDSDGITLAVDQHSAQPNQIIRFDFSLSSPWTYQSGVYREYFQPVLEGTPNWNVGAVSWQEVTVNRP